MCAFRPFEWMLCFVVLCGSAFLARAQESEQSADTVRLDTLAKRYEVTQALYRMQVHKIQSSGEEDPTYPVFPTHETIAQFLDLASDTEDRTVGMQALYLIFMQAVAGGDPEAPISIARERAIDIAIERYIDEPQLQAFFRYLGAGARSARAESFLRTALELSPHREVRAMATYYLARRLLRQSEYPMYARQLREECAAYPDTPRTQALLQSIPRLETVSRQQAAAYRRESVALLEVLQADYADVPHVRYYGTGPARTRITEYVDPSGKQRRRFAELAEAMLFQLEHLQVGSVAPEIEGIDQDGKPFRLSDYRGQIVFLAFCANWCGPCVAMYPQERELLETYADRPVAILHVNADDELGTLQDSVERGEITWRSWWDGKDGPIAAKWHVDSWPTTFLLDADGIIRYRNIRGSMLEHTVASQLDELE